MTNLLVSVRNAEEANEALLGGADWIDVKEPRNGSLGAPSVKQLDDVRSAVRGRASLSVALGELQDEPSGQLLSRLEGVSFAKVGLSRCAGDREWRGRLANLIHRLPPGVDSVAVVYVDHRGAGAPSPRSVIEFARKHECRALLFDTFDKTQGCLFDHLPGRKLDELIEMARESHLAIALAGSLTRNSFSRAVASAPDIVAVRGAACRGGRDGFVDAALVKHLAMQLSTPRAGAHEISSGHILDSFQ